METITYSAMHMHAKDVTPRQHTDHGDGQYSIALTPNGDAASVYFMGTPEELGNLVGRLSLAVVEAVHIERQRVEGLVAS